MISRIESYFAEHFGHVPEVIASAPGRVEFLGNHTDYNGGLVLGGAINRRLWVGLSRRADGECHLTSEDLGEISTLPASSITEVRPRSWIKYPLAVLQVMEKMGIRPAGFNLAVRSDIPIGAGLSSSAALELAAALAFDRLLELGLSTVDLVTIAHRAETDYVGVPCGLLDQTTIAYAEKNCLVCLDASDRTHSTIPIENGTALWLFQTHESHELDRSPYADRRNECKQSLRLLQTVIPKISRLTQLNPADVSAYAHKLPNVLADRAAHVVGEQARVIEVGTLENVSRIGELLFASHESSSRFFENSTKALDFTVNNLRGRRGVLGARLTGAGFGGAAMAWTTTSFRQADAGDVAAAYASRFDAACKVLNVEWSDGMRVESVREAPT